MTISDSSPQRHERFWFSDGNLLLLVDNTLYYVHRFFFETYATNFSVKELKFEGIKTYATNFSVKDLQFEGSGATPYVLDADVTAVDFDHLLACLYPRALWVDDIQTCEGWTSVLKLATKWEFDSLRTRALSKIMETAASPIDKVVLGRQYDLPDLLLPGYVALCQSTVPISYEDALRLGMQDVVDIYHIRHQLYGSAVAPVPYEEAMAKVKAYASAEDQAGSPKDAQAALPSASDVGRVMVPEARPTDEESDGGQVNSVSDKESSSSDPFTDAREHEIDGLDVQVAVPNTEHDLVDLYISAKGDADNRQPSGDPEYLDASDAGSPADARFDIVSEARTANDEFDGKPGTFIFYRNPSSSEGSWGVPPEDGNRWQTQPEAASHDIAVPSVRSGIVSSRVSEGGSSASPTHIAKSPPPASLGQTFYLDKLTTENFGFLSEQMIQWLNTNDTQTLHHFTQLVVKTVVEERGLFDVARRLCGKVVTRISGNTVAGPALFREYLGQACREGLESVSMNCITTAEEVQGAGIQRVRLIEFIGELSGGPLMAIDVVHRMVAALLADRHNEEKSITLCMLLKKIGASWDNGVKMKRERMNGWFQNIGTLAQDHRSLRARCELLDIIELRQRGWVFPR